MPGATTATPTPPVIIIRHQPKPGGGTVTSSVPANEEEDAAGDEDATDGMKQMQDFEPGDPVDKVTDGIIQPFIWGMYFLFWSLTYSSCGWGREPGEDIPRRVGLLIFILLRHAFARMCCSPYEGPQRLETSRCKKVCARIFQTGVTILALLNERASRTIFKDYFSWIDEAVFVRYEADDATVASSFGNSTAQESSEVLPCKVIYSWPTFALIYDTLLFVGIINVIFVAAKNAVKLCTPEAPDKRRIARVALNSFLFLVTVGAVLRSCFLAYPLLHRILFHEEVPSDIEEHPETSSAVVLASVTLGIAMMWTLTWSLSLCKRTTCVVWFLYNLLFGLLTFFGFISIIVLIQHDSKDQDKGSMTLEEKKTVSLRLLEMWGFHVVLFGLPLYILHRRDFMKLGKNTYAAGAYACCVPSFPAICPWICLQNCKVGMNTCCENDWDCKDSPGSRDYDYNPSSRNRGPFIPQIPYPTRSVSIGGGGRGGYGYNRGSSMPWNGGHPSFIRTNNFGVPI